MQFQGTQTFLSPWKIDQPETRFWTRWAMGNVCAACRFGASLRNHLPWCQYVADKLDPAVSISNSITGSIDVQAAGGAAAEEQLVDLYYIVHFATCDATG